VVIDTRTKEVFPKGFIPGSIFIGIDDTFAPWVGTLIPNLMQPILFLADEGKEHEVITRLARVGYDNPIGYLAGGISAWQNAGLTLGTLREISAEEFPKLFQTQGNISLLDVRRESEYKVEHIIGAENFPLDFINQNMSKLSLQKTYYIHCAGGYRSLIASSILKSRGFQKVINIKGGYNLLKGTKLSKTKHEEVNTEL
jgi:rhodanese-related sulfurtransferase